MLLLLSLSAQAKSWCAGGLAVHEWGVQVFDGDGTPSADVPMPSWFHTAPPTTPVASGEPVRGMMPDSGERALPVLQFHVASPEYFYDTPVDIGVGFTRGEASAWYPQVSRYLPAAVANSPRAQAKRAEIVEQRQAGADTYTIFHRTEQPENNPLLPADPTRQLAWEHLTLSAEPPQRPAATTVGWVDDLRDVPGALWVSTTEATERFVFYEATTTEQPAVALSRADDGRLRLTNHSDWTVHDVLLTHRSGGVANVFVPAIPPGAWIDVALTAETVPDPLALYTGRLSDPGLTIQHLGRLGSGDPCVMMLDPAVPTEQATDHRLLPAEVAVLMDVWSARLFDQPGTTLVYRESTEALDALMPLSIHTPMTYYTQLRRLGLVVWEDVALP